MIHFFVVLGTTHVQTQCVILHSSEVSTSKEERKKERAALMTIYHNAKILSPMWQPGPSLLSVFFERVPSKIG